ncbi:MAG: hypothetical protein DELT_02516 [Desulfovibrio sp.]
MIEGLNIRCNIGPVELLRTPYLELAYKRRAVLSRGVIHIPDPEGKARAVLAKDQKMKFRFGYRGEINYWHEWEGTIESIDQPSQDSTNPDAVIVRGVGLEKRLSTTLVKESFHNEAADAVARRLLSLTGLAVAGVEIPGDVLPHQTFSNVPVARALKQIEHTLRRSFGHDLSKHAVWLGESGLMWSDGDEPGDVYTIETAKNLIDHTPPAKAGEMGAVISVLLPGLTDSRKVRIRDHRRQINTLERAEEVIHVLQASGNSTTVMYGKNSGWGG